MVYIVANGYMTGSGSNQSITNIVEFGYFYMPDTYEPLTVMGTINPVGFRLPHKWVKGEITVLSEVFTPMSAYVKSGSDNTSATWCIVQTCTTGSTVTYRFTGLYFLNERVTAKDGENVLTTYPFMATNVFCYKS